MLIAQFTDFTPRAVFANNAADHNRKIGVSRRSRNLLFGGNCSRALSRNFISDIAVGEFLNPQRSALRAPSRAYAGSWSGLPQQASRGYESLIINAELTAEKSLPA